MTLFYCVIVFVCLGRDLNLDFNWIQVSVRSGRGTIYHSGGSKGGAPGVRPHPMVQNFLNFMQFFGKFGKIIGRHPLPEELAPPPTENPGSAPVSDTNQRSLSLIDTSFIC